MDTLTNDILQWDVRSWAKALRFWESRVRWDRMAAGLELGGRAGGLSLWMAKGGLQVVCSDLENTAATAGPLHARRGVSPQITYRDIDATNIPYEDHFDLIAFKSIIGGIGRDGHIERQRAVFAQIHKALKPGGHARIRRKPGRFTVSPPVPEVVCALGRQLALCHHGRNAGLPRSLLQP